MTKNPHSTSCECCLMPLDKDPLGEKRENPRYCSYCFSSGKLHAEDAKDLKEFQNICYANMRSGGHSWIMAHLYTWIIRFAPYWKERNKK